LAAEARELYDRVADPAVTEEAMEAMVSLLDRLSKDGLVTVAKALELKVTKNKTKADITEAIRRRFYSRKGASQRAGLLDPPSSESNGDRGDDGIEDE
jgi:hypothetical protein